MNEKIITELRERIATDRNPEWVRALFDMAVNTKSLELNKEVRAICMERSRAGEDFIDLYWETRLFGARNGVFEDYLLYLEKNRPAKERFYQPRRKKLKEAVNLMQDMLDDKLDEGVIAQPPRTGKSSIIMFFFTYIIGLRPELSNLYSAYSAGITSAMYTGVLEVINDSTTYTWHEIFPDRKLASTNASDLLIDIDRKKRYASLTCRSLYGTLNGACDCEGFLIADDLLSGIEEALNPDRLNRAWTLTDNNLLARAKKKAKILFVGTRWSVKDPTGRRLELLETNEKFKSRRHRVLCMPALDPVTDESNFDYDYDVGFDTEYYRQRRASFQENNDEASWDAQYQQEPVEREGQLFPSEHLRYYNGELPEGEPDRIFMACDTAWGGGDFVSAPVGVQYGDTLYVPSVVFDDGDKYVTRPKVLEQIIRMNVGSAHFEANNGGEEYREWIDTQLREQGKKINITSSYAPTNKRKEARIFEAAPEIREVYFLERGKRDKDYNLFMSWLCRYSITGKNAHDDAPDSMAMLMDMKKYGARTRVQIFKRPF